MDEQRRMEVVRSLFEGWSIGDFSGGRDHFSKEVTATWSEPPSDIVSRGQGELSVALRSLFAQWDRFRAVPEDVRPLGDSAVFVTALQSATGKGSGVEVDARVSIVFVFEDDLITGLHWHFDRELALRSAGFDDAG